MLQSIRFQIEALEAACNGRPTDREQRKRIKEARILELVILARLPDRTMN